MKTAIKFAIVLGIICLIMGSGVALVYATFKDRIAERQQQQLQILLREVLPADQGEITRLAEETDVYVVRNADGQPAAYAAEGSSSGYSGPVTVLVGVWARPGMPIRRVVVLSQTETPGLGANVSQTRSTYTLWQKIFGSDEPEQLYNEFLDQFEGATFDPQTGRPDKEIDAITAATVTSNATTRAVRQAVEKIRTQAAAGEAQH